MSIVGLVSIGLGSVIVFLGGSNTVGLVSMILGACILIGGIGFGGSCTVGLVSTTF